MDTVKKAPIKVQGIKILKENSDCRRFHFGFGDGPNDLALLNACDTKSPWVMPVIP